jgi:hypothetical protein
MLNVAAAVAASESVTVTVKVLVPPTVGVPVIAPDELNCRDAGKLPLAMDHAYGDWPPTALSVAL